MKICMMPLIYRNTKLHTFSMMTAVLISEASQLERGELRQRANSEKDPTPLYYSNFGQLGHESALLRPTLLRNSRLDFAVSKDLFLLRNDQLFALFRSVQLQCHLFGHACLRPRSTERKMETVQTIEQKRFPNACVQIVPIVITKHPSLSNRV